VKFFHPPHLYCVTTLPSKTNTTANIGVKCLHTNYSSVSTSCCRSEYLVWGRQGWSLLIPKRKLTAHTTAISSSRGSGAWHQSNMSSLQVDTAAGWSASAHRPDQDGLSEKEHINFNEPHMWPPNSPDIYSVDCAIWGAPQQRVYRQRQFNTVEEVKQSIVTER